MRYDNRICFLTPVPIIDMSPYAIHPFSIDDCTADSQRIDMWQFSLSDLHPQAFALLSPDEQIRARRFYFDRHERRFTMARAGMRLILSRYLHEKSEKIHFNYNHYGKPELGPGHTLHFNLSHSGDRAFLAVGKNFPMGIDVENFSDRPYQDIAENLFSKTEVAALASLPAKDIALGFFHIWAQKEAFIKACGMGLSYPTQTFSVPVLPETSRQIADTLHDKFWCMRSFQPTADCCAALCFEPAVTTLRMIKIDDYGQLWT